MPRRSDLPSVDAMAEAWQREFPDADLTHFLLGAALMRIAQVVGKDLLDQSQRLFGSTAAELGLLFALRRQGPPYAARPRTLTRTLLITSGAVTKQIDRLAARGLVARAADPDSLNGQLVSLTAEGLAMTETAVRHLAAHSVVSKVAAHLPEETVAGGAAFLRALLRGFVAQQSAEPTRGSSGAS